MDNSGGYSKVQLSRSVLLQRRAGVSSVDMADVALGPSAEPLLVHRGKQDVSAAVGGESIRTSRDKRVPTSVHATLETFIMWQQR